MRTLVLGNSPITTTNPNQDVPINISNMQESTLTQGQISPNDKSVLDGFRNCMIPQ
jgi:hypothetical protein